MLVKSFEPHIISDAFGLVKLTTTLRICVVRDFKAPTYQITLPPINCYVVHI